MGNWTETSKKIKDWIRPIDLVILILLALLSFIILHHVHSEDFFKEQLSKMNKISESITTCSWLIDDINWWISDLNTKFDKGLIITVSENEN